MKWPLPFVRRKAKSKRVPISREAIEHKRRLLRRDNTHTPLADRDWSAELASFHRVRAMLLRDTALAGTPKLFDEFVRTALDGTPAEFDALLGDDGSPSMLEGER